MSDLTGVLMRGTGPIVDINVPVEITDDTAHIEVADDSAIGRMIASSPEDPHGTPTMAILIDGRYEQFTLKQYAFCCESTINGTQKIALKASFERFATKYDAIIRHCVRARTELGAQTEES